jgi:predicted phage replisome organizer
MSDNKKYYYLKMKETFFDGEEMKILESQPNGVIYQNLYLKMCLLSLKSGGALLFKDTLPYDVVMLSSVLRVNIDTVKNGIEIFEKMGLVDIIDNKTIYMSDIQSLIGQSSSEGERKKLYRAKIKRIKKITSGQTSGHSSALVPQKMGQRTPELELDSQLYSKTKSKRSNVFVKPEIDEVKEYCQERKNRIDAERFIDYYESIGWMVGKKKMKDWRAAVRTWEKNDKERKPDIGTYTRPKCKCGGEFNPGGFCTKCGAEIS